MCTAVDSSEIAWTAHSPTWTHKISLDRSVSFASLAPSWLILALLTRLFLLVNRNSASMSSLKVLLIKKIYLSMKRHTTTKTPHHYSSICLPRPPIPLLAKLGRQAGNGVWSDNSSASAVTHQLPLSSRSADQSLDRT